MISEETYFFNICLLYHLLAGDFSKELDSRVKEQVAMLRGKEECKVVE
jgi:hypothetical protein